MHRFFKILTPIAGAVFPPNSALHYCRLGDKARALPKRSVYLSVPLKVYALTFYNNTQYTKKRPITAVGRGKLIWWRILYALNLARSISPSCLKTIMPLNSPRNESRKMTPLRAIFGTHIMWYTRLSLDTECLHPGGCEPFEL